MTKYLQKRKDGGWRFSRRIPRDVRQPDEPDYVRISIRAKTEAQAAIRAEEMSREYDALWAARRRLDGGEAQSRYLAAKAIARQGGFEYRAADQFTSGEVRELLERLETLTNGTARPLLGLVPEATLCLSRLVAEIEALDVVSLARKSPNQLKRWRQGRERAVANLIKVIGDKEIGKLGRADARAFRDDWSARILDAGGKGAVSANKDMQHIAAMSRRALDAQGIDWSNPFVGLRIAERRAVSPHAISPGEAITILAADSDLNDEARAIVEILAQMGLRPSEVCNLRPEDIRVDATVPHVAVSERADRDIKTARAARMIPLVGAALNAAMQFPEGFPRYRDKEASFCALAGPWMRRKLPGVADLSAYSWRHGFKDRLDRCDTSERMRVEIMGHELESERYGAGPTLGDMAPVLQAVALRW